MQLVCPHCHNPMERTENEALEEIVCATCGSSFRLERERTRSYSEDHRRLEKFELLEQVGLGSFGVVWKARDTDLNRLVAVKIPHAGRLVTPQDEERFVREGRSAAQLRHPSIVSVHQVGRHEGVPYLVADFIEGATLADFLTTRRPGIREAAELVAQIAEALDYAHTMGVVHRDIKPSNIMLERPSVSAGVGLDKPMLMDFGLALRDEVEATMTQDGQILGTPAYMSPEQAAGWSHQLDARSDIYSLGVVLYQLLTGELPFRGNSRMQMEQVLREEPRPPRRLNDKIPRDLETICLKAMAKDPTRRYATARALADDLRRFLHGEPIHARPMGAWERTVNWVKRRPAVAALLLVSAVAALALVAVVVGMAYNTRLQTAFNAEEEQRKRAETTLYFNRIVLAEREWQANNIGRAEKLLEECPADLRGWEWHYLKRLCHSDLMTLRGHGDQVYGVGYSPDGKLIASASWDRTVRIWHAKTGELIRSLPLPGWAERVAFSPDGRQLASATVEWNKPAQIKVWDVETWKELLTITIPGNTAPIYRVVFSPDGERLASASNDGTARIWNAKSGAILLEIPTKGEGVSDVAFSPDGQQLATAGGTLELFVVAKNPAAKIWDAKTGRLIRSFIGHQGALTSVAFSPDGERLASSSFDRTVKIWNTKTGVELVTLRGHTQFVTSVAFSPEGDRVASASEDGAVKVWDAATGQEKFTLRGHAGLVNGVAFSPDGLRLASGSEDKTVKVWNAMTGQEAFNLASSSIWATSVAFSPIEKTIAWTTVDNAVKLWDGESIRTLTGHTRPVWKVVFNPDGQKIATAGGDWTSNTSPGEVKMWDIRTGREIQNFPGHRGVVWTVAFSPDGRCIASAGGELTNVPGVVKIWNASTGKEIFPLRGHTGGVSCVAFSPDGLRLATASGDSTVKIWDMNNGEEIRTLSGHTGVVHGVAFSPDGHWLASASGDKTVKIWNAANGQEVGSLRGHTNFVLSVHFSPDGRRIGTASVDQTVKLWDVNAGQEILTLRGHTGPVWSIAFSPDGKRIASASQDGTVRIWDATPLDEKGGQPQQ